MPWLGAVTAAAAHLKGSLSHSTIDYLHPLVLIIYSVVLRCLFVMHKSLVTVNSNKSLTFKIKLQQVLSIAKLLIDSASLITSREHPNWVYSAKSNWKHWLCTSNFILTCTKFGEPHIPHPSRNTGLVETLLFSC